VNHYPDSVQGFVTTKRWATDERAVAMTITLLLVSLAQLVVSLIGLFRSNSPKT
jgi:hypothetical protein